MEPHEAQHAAAFSNGWTPHCPTPCRCFARPMSVFSNARCLVLSLPGSWRSFFQMLVVPGEDAIQAIQEVLLLVKAVRLARVNDELGLDAVALQAAVKFLALAERIDQVGISLENQGRRFHILEMDEGRTVQEAGDFFRLIRDAVEPLTVGGDLLGAICGDE